MVDGKGNLYLADTFNDYAEKLCASFSVRYTFLDGKWYCGVPSVPPAQLLVRRLSLGTLLKNTTSVCISCSLRFSSTGFLSRLQRRKPFRALRKAVGVSIVIRHHRNPNPSGGTNPLKITGADPFFSLNIRLASSCEPHKEESIGNGVDHSVIDSPI